MTIIPGHVVSYRNRQLFVDNRGRRGGVAMIVLKVNPLVVSDLDLAVVIEGVPEDQLEIHGSISQDNLQHLLLRWFHQDM